MKDAGGPELTSSRMSVANMPCRMEGDISDMVMSYRFPGHMPWYSPSLAGEGKKVEYLQKGLAERGFPDLF